MHTWNSEEAQAPCVEIRDYRETVEFREPAISTVRVGEGSTCF